MFKQQQLLAKSKARSVSSELTYERPFQAVGMRNPHAQPDLSIKQSVLSSVRVAGIVLGTAIVVIIALRNSFMWYMQEFWGASSDFWQSGWTVVYRDWLGENPYVAFTLIYPVGILVFYLFNTFFMLVEMTGQPSVMLQYKIQTNKEVPLDHARVYSCLKVTLVNALLVGPLVHCGYVYWMAGKDGSESDLLELPSFFSALLHLAACAIVEEVLFYYSHRLFHTPFFYRRFHKIHHEWTAPIGLTAIYCHPVEHLVANCIPVTAGPALMRSHPAVSMTWVTIVFLQTTIAHCGFHLPFAPSSEMHDYHHAKFNQNFGVLGILDQLHGTNERFVASKEYQRHFMLTSTTPVRTLVPDEPKKCHG